MEVEQILLNIFEWLGILLACLYGGLYFIVGFIQLSKKMIPRWSAITIAVAGGITVFSALQIHHIPLMPFLFVVSLLMLQVMAVVHGFHLHGKMNLAHHMIRFILSAIIIVLVVM